MSESFYFPTFSGLLTEEHRRKIGAALWEFLWCISATTKETTNGDEILGIVYGGKPVSYNEVAKMLGGSKSTVKRNFEKLEEEGYISMKRTPYGHIVTVHKSKKFKKTTETPKGAKNGTGAGNEYRGAENDYPRAENDYSNKDIELDIKPDINTTTKKSAYEGASDGVSTTDPMRGDSTEAKPVEEISHTPDVQIQKLLDGFVELRNHGLMTSPDDYQQAKKIFAAGIPLEDALIWMKEKFDSYKPKHPNARINVLSYCVGHIFDRHAEKTAKENGTHDKATIHQYRGRVSGSAGKGKSTDQLFRDLEAARNAWGGG